MVEIVERRTGLKGQAVLCGWRSRLCSLPVSINLATLNAEALFLKAEIPKLLTFRYQLEDSPAAACVKDQAPRGAQQVGGYSASRQFDPTFGESWKKSASSYLDPSWTSTPWCKSCWLMQTSPPQERTILAASLMFCVISAPNGPSGGTSGRGRPAPTPGQT